MGHLDLTIIWAGIIGFAVFAGSVAKIVRERVRSAASWQSSGRGQVLV